MNMNPFEIIESSDQIHLQVRGNISVQNAQACLEILRVFQRSEKPLLLDLNGVTTADISFLQLVCSLHRTCLKAGQSLTISGNIPDTFKTILETAGYRRPKACTQGGDNPCLWSWRDES
jgi:anti-anti-sigma regulatory factor